MEKKNNTGLCADTIGTNVKPWSGGSPADLVLSRVGSLSLWISMSPPCISPVRSWRMGDGHLEDEGMRDGRQIILKCPSSVHMKTSTSDTKQLIPLCHFSSSHCEENPAAGFSWQVKKPAVMVPTKRSRCSTSLSAALH